MAMVDFNDEGLSFSYYASKRSNDSRDHPCDFRDHKPEISAADLSDTNRWQHHLNRCCIVNWLTDLGHQVNPNSLAKTLTISCKHQTGVEKTAWESLCSIQLKKGGKISRRRETCGEKMDLTLFYLFCEIQAIYGIKLWYTTGWYSITDQWA